MGVTIVDIANVLGISTSTVSRALNNKEEISQVLRKKVISTAEGMGYHVNSVASSLRRGRTNLIGIIAPHINDPFYAEVISGILIAAGRSNLAAIIRQSDPGTNSETNVIKAMIGNRVDGIIIFPFAGLSTPENAIPESDNTPMVCIQKRLERANTPVVMFDQTKSVYDVVCHLITRRCKEILFIGNDEQMDSEYLKGYKLALEKHCLDYDQKLVTFVNTMHELHGIIDEKILSSSSNVDGVVAVSDLRALSVLNNLMQNGISVPKNIAVAGCGADRPAWNCAPQLTTIDNMARNLGETAGKHLINHIQTKRTGKFDQQIIVQHQLLARDSTAR